MRKLLFRSRSGEGYPMVIAVTLCLLMQRVTAMTMG